MSDAATPRRIWLCADDYGFSPGINRGIRELIERRRINATSVMVVGPAIGRDEARALNELAGDGCAIGLHATLTAPLHPLTMPFRPLEGGMFLPLSKMLRTSVLHRHDRQMIRAELAAQIAAFTDLFGRTPDYVDGHQHVQLFPQVRDAFLDAVKIAAPNAWVRQCGRSQPLAQRLGQPKALLLDALSVRFRARAAHAGIAFNPGFAGAYDLTRNADFGREMRGFLNGLPDGGLIMCHPGYVDDTLMRLDHVTHQREREQAFLAGQGLDDLLNDCGVTLAQPKTDAPVEMSHGKI